MGLIVTILLGALVGYIAAHVMGRREGFVMSAVIGVIGAILGNVVSNLLGQGNQSALNFDLSNILWALAGSVLVVAILNMVQHRTPRV